MQKFSPWPIALGLATLPSISSGQYKGTPETNNVDLNNADLSSILRGGGTIPANEFFNNNEDLKVPYNESAPEPEIRYITAPTPEQPNPYLLAAFQVSLLVGGMGGLYYFLNRRNQRASSDAQNESKIATPTHDVSELPTLRLANVGAIGDVREEIEDFISPIKEFASGKDVPYERCLMLTGPTGVGKTRLARSIAGELGVPFFEINSGAFATHIYVGDGLKRIEDQLTIAHQKVKAHEDFLRKQPGATGKERGIIVLFIDEFDSVGRARGKKTSGSEDDKVTNLFLSITDKSNPAYSRIIVLAATNNPDVIDEALKRPGRFQQLQITAPRTIKQRMEIIDTLVPELLKNISIDSEVTGWLARTGVNLSGAEIAGIIENAARITTKSNREKVLLEDIAEGYFRLVGGPRRKDPFHESDQIHVMVHELGHAVIAHLVGSNIEFISSVAREKWLGVVGSHQPEEWTARHSFDSYIKDCVVHLGGRAAEKVTFQIGQVTDGAGGDLQSTQRLASQLIKLSLVGKNFDLGLDGTEFTQGQRDLLNQLVAKCEEIALKVIVTLGKDWLLQHATECVHEAKELLGSEARDYVAGILADKEDELRAILLNELTLLAESDIGPGLVTKN